MNLIIAFWRIVTPYCFLTALTSSEIARRRGLEKILRERRRATGASGPLIRMRSWWSL